MKHFLQAQWQRIILRSHNELLPQQLLKPLTSISNNAFRRPAQPDPFIPVIIPFMYNGELLAYLVTVSTIISTHQAYKHRYTKRPCLHLGRGLHLLEASCWVSFKWLVVPLCRGQHGSDCLDRAGAGQLTHPALLTARTLLLLSSDPKEDCNKIHTILWGSKAYHLHRCT